MSVWEILGATGAVVLLGAYLWGWVEALRRRK